LLSINNRTFHQILRITTIKRYQVVKVLPNINAINLKIFLLKTL